MEFLLHGRQDKLFFGNCPKTIKEAVTKLDFGRGYSIANLASNRRSEHEIWNAKQIRRIEENLVVGRLFLDRLHKEPKTTTEAHEWVTRLVNLMCKPESQKLMDRQENLPEGTYETSEFLKSVEAQRNPLALLGQLRLWLLADENDVHFDWAGMLSTCTSIWKTILPILGDHKMFQGEQDMLDTPGNTTARLLEMAAIGQNIGVSVPLFETIWQSIQSTIQTPSSEQNGNKTWVGDLRLNKLLNDSTPTIMLMNPGPVSFSNIYANWSNDDKRESRVGRAVWHAMQELGDKAYNGGNNEEQRDGEAGDKSVTEEAAGEELVNDMHTDGDELSDHSDSQDERTEEIDEAASDAGSDFSVHEFTFDLNALAKNGSNHIIMGNNMKAPVVINSMQMSQLRAGPDGGLVVGGRAPSQASRIEMLPPRQSEHARAIASAEDVPELCACGLSRYGVSVRPILKMDTKAGKLQHQCMGALFEGIDVPNRDLGDAIKVRRVIVPGSQRETEEK
ncbi:hypothetical protein J4E93_008405 [Alternaria ventricosa]|uniref:uncharacterized protein n=1 Tax=Alternaria ventricosa TaxID=1187951 RepID=UPI0020C4120A|nr:uncharacterized protein J4E93_008405 [Alternaria ventricosa]KAI4640812.1 hypothetical protein J4E93_008405 [Alternaria ventricosa]